MKFGKIYIKENELTFKRRIKTYQIPCEDIVWAYHRQEDGEVGVHQKVVHQVIHYIVILTKLDKKYQFEMTREEADACLKYLKECNDLMIIGFPNGEALPLESIFNTRDLGGIRTEDGCMILPHQLIRSGELYHLSEKDQQLLTEEYRVKMILDFRTEEEREKKPDPMLYGVTHMDHPIFDEAVPGISHEGNYLKAFTEVRENPEEYMMRMYQKLVLDPYVQKQYARFFEYLLENPENQAVLWHCSVGKDRAGLATVLLLYALGVPRGVIVDDYMKSNFYLKQEIDYYLRLLRSRKIEETVVENVYAFLSAKECYLQSALSTIQSEYGSMEKYLRKAMFLTNRQMDRLKKRYLV